MTADEGVPNAVGQAAAGFRFAVASHIVRLLCKVSGVVVLARLVSPAEHGVFAMAASLVFLLMLFRDFGMGAAAVQARELSEGQKTALWHLHVGLGFALAVVALALAPVAAAFYRESRVAPLLAVLSVSFVLNGANSWPRTLLHRELHFRDMNRVETAGALAGTVAMIVAGYLDAGAFAFVAFLIGSEATMLAAAWWLSPWRPRARADWRGLHSLANTGIHLTGYNLLLYGLQQADTLLMGRWFGAAPLGLYNRAAQLLIQPMTHLAAPFTQVLTATLARLGSDSPLFRRQFCDTTNAIAHLTLPVAVACMVLPGEIVRIVLGPNWPDATPLLGWLALSAATSFLTATTYALCVATGNPSRLTQLTAVALPVTLFSLWAGRAHGPVGLAAGLAISNVCLLLPRLWWSSRRSPIRLRDFGRALTGPIVTAGALAVGLAVGRTLARDAGPAAQFGTAAVCGMAAIALCALCWRRIGREFKSVAAHLPFGGGSA